MVKNIGIIGTGNMGTVLGKKLVSKGYNVLFGSRTPDKAKKLAKSIGQNADGGTIAEAAKFGEIIILAVHYTVVEQVLKTAGSIDGKILLDISNPVAPDFSGLSLGYTTSAAEEIAKLVPKAKVVKSFNHVFAKNIGNPEFGTQKSTQFYCGDDPDAKKQVAKLIEDIGFEAIDAGPLKTARYLEPLGMLMINLGFAQKMGIDIAYKLVRR